MVRRKNGADLPRRAGLRTQTRGNNCLRMPRGQSTPSPGRVVSSILPIILHQPSPSVVPDLRVPLNAVRPADQHQSPPPLSPSQGTQESYSKPIQGIFPFSILRLCLCSPSNESGLHRWHEQLGFLGGWVFFFF